MSSSAVFGNVDIYLHVMRWVTPGDFVRCTQVCKWAFKASKEIEKSLFKSFHVKAQFRVENDNYSCKSYVVLTETTKDGHPRDLCAKYLGDPVVEDPIHRMKEIDELCELDSTGIRKYQKYRGAYIYPAVKRPVRKDEVVIMDQFGKIIQINSVGSVNINKLKRESIKNNWNMVVGPSEIQIGISKHNLIKLFQNPLTGKNFIFHGHALKEIFDLEHVCEPSSSIVFVMREVPKKLDSNVKAAGFVPLVLLCGFDILETGNCVYHNAADGSPVYARTNETLRIKGYFSGSYGSATFCLGLGPFSSDNGVQVNFSHNSVSTIPCISAEEPISLEAMDLDSDFESGTDEEEGLVDEM